MKPTGSVKKKPDLHFWKSCIKRVAGQEQNSLREYSSGAWRYGRRWDRRCDRTPGEK